MKHKPKSIMSEQRRYFTGRSPAFRTSPSSSVVDPATSHLPHDLDKRTLPIDATNQVTDFLSPGRAGSCGNLITTKECAPRFFQYAH